MLENNQSPYKRIAKKGLMPIKINVSHVLFFVDIRYIWSYICLKTKSLWDYLFEPSVSIVINFRQLIPSGILLCSFAKQKTVNKGVRYKYWFYLWPQNNIILLKKDVLNLFCYTCGFANNTNWLQGVLGQMFNSLAWIE